MKILMENWRSYQKQLLKEGSKFSKELRSLIDDDQKLRNLFQQEIEKAGGWSQELVNQFVEKYKDQGARSDDIFDSKSVEEKFAKLFPKLDFSNFDDDDWNNFNALIMHQREPEHLEMRKKALSEMIKAKKWWRSLATDMARGANMLPELNGVKLSYGKDKDDDNGGKVDLLLKKKGMTWEQLVEKLGVKI